MYRKYDGRFKTQIMTIFAGEYYISSSQEVISTVLGSCIAVCLYDSVNKIGGMNHFMLPSGNQESFIHDSVIDKDKLTEQSMRYGITAMEVLVGEMQKRGARRTHMKAKIFGGGKVINKSMTGPSVGDKNIGFAKAYLKMEKIPIESENVGETFGRKIYFLTENNSVFLKRVELEPAVEEERNYMKKLQALKQKSDVTIF